MAREKRRNSEKRKEKSRDAARSRRSKETEIFTELAECLPLSEHIVNQLDKASIMRLAISQLKIGDVLDAVGISDGSDGGSDVECIDSDEENGNGFKGLLAKIKNEQGMQDDHMITNTDGEDKMESVLPTGHISQLYMKGLEGTMIILSNDGDFVYLSENVDKYLGMQQIEMMGQSIYDYIHPCDHEEIRNALNMKSGSGSQEQQHDDDALSSLVYSEIRTFSVRMKCTLTTKGRNVNLKSAPYKVMKCSGRLVICNKQEEVLSDSCNSGASSPPSTSPPHPKPYLLAVIEPIPHPSNIEVPLDSSTFLSKHEMDMSFIFCDDRIEELAGYDPSAMVGQSYFDFYHALDSENIKKTFKDLYSKGQATTPAYRMLAANGGYIWIITQATTINNSRNQKPQSVVCVHYVLSGVEEKGVILSNIQEDLAMPAGSAIPITVTTKIETLSPMPISPAPLTPPPSCTNPVLMDDALLQQEQQEQQQLQLDLLPPKLELSTESIFAPKTKDMDKPLCRPQGLLPYLTDDSDDLSYLSPMAGDDMMSLPFTNSSNKTTTDFLLSPVTPPMTSPMLSMAKSPQKMNGQAGLLSPGRFSAGIVSSNNCSRPPSPDVDYLSCVMPLELDPMEKFLTQVDNTTTSSTQQQQQELMSNGLCIVQNKDEGGLGQEDMIDFAMRAPYIPMDSDQDLDLLPTSTATLFNLSKDDINPSVFGRTEYVFGPKETLFEEPKPLPKRSLRDMLGESTVVASIEQPPETKYLQMKRPLDMNCLEKGPPISKTARLEESVSTVSSASIQPGQSKGVNPANAKANANKNSVLLNLLLTGEDISYGYKVSQKRIVSPNTAKTKLPETNMFNSLTRQDCEVNAPTKCGKLLQGLELFNALD